MSSGSRWRRIAPTLTLGVVGFCGNVAWQIVLPVLPLHLARIGYSPAGIGVLIGISSLSMGLVELQAGTIAAAVGRWRSLLAGYAATALCLNLTAVAQARVPLAGALAAVGAAKGVVVPALHAAVADSVHGTTRGRAFGLLWFGLSLATLVGPAIGGFTAGHYGDRAAFVAGSVFSLIAFAIIAARPMPRQAAAGASLRDLAALLSNASFMRLSISVLVCFSLAGIWTTFLPLYAAREGITIIVIGWVFAIQGCMYVLMQIPTGWLVGSERGGRLALFGIVGMASIELIVPLLHGTASLIGAAAIFGAAYGLMPVTFVTLVTRAVSSPRYTLALGVYNSAIDLGLFAGPLLGALAARFGVTAPFLLALPLATLAFGIGVWASRAARAPIASR